VNAVPPVFAGLEVDRTGRYSCPLCEVQRTGADVDTGWVACPMVRNQMICLGSCLDHQAAARSRTFDTHPERYLFSKLAKETRQSEQVLRAVCLRHQVQVIDDRLRSRADEAIDLMALRHHVSDALVKATTA
jgi:hypothetical protein